MDYFILPVGVYLFVNFVFPTVTTWFFERIVEPRAQIARDRRAATAPAPPEKTNAEKFAATRKAMDELKARLAADRV